MVSDEREPTARDLLIAMWDASTAKPSSTRSKHAWALASGHIVLFAAWAVDTVGRENLLLTMEWSTQDIDRLTSTAFGESTAKWKSAPERARGMASERQRRWNDYGGAFGNRSGPG